MKKILLFSLLLLLSSLTGCSTKTDESMENLQKKVAQLESDFADMQTQTVDTPKADSVTEPLASIEGLTSAVSKIADKVEEIVPAGSDTSRMGQYFGLKNNIKQLEQKINAYDDNLEIQYKNSTLDYTDYRIQEREAGTLQQQLNATKEKLRLKFRMDE